MQNILRNRSLHFFGAYALFAIAVAFVVTYILGSASTAFADTNTNYNGYNGYYDNGNGYYGDNNGYYGNQYYGNNNYGNSNGYYGDTNNNNDDIVVHLYIDGRSASDENNLTSMFPMTYNVSGPNGGGAQNQTYSLGPNNTPRPYEFRYNRGQWQGNGSFSMNAAMGNGWAQQCAPYNNNGWDANHNWVNGPRYSLSGYSWGDTMNQALAMSPSTTAPNFSFGSANMPRHIIIWAHDCSINSGSIGGDVIGGNAPLMVTSVIPVDTSAIADGTFENGWKFLFNITVPYNEQDIGMRFADWVRTNGFGTIPVANRIRISSNQSANNSWSLIPGSNMYSVPPLHLIGDLDQSRPGRQVQIAVEAAIAPGTQNGAYTTSYGVRSQ